MNDVFKYRPEEGFDTPESCHIVEVFNNEIDNECSIVQATVLPGVTTKLHSLKDTVERYVILKGTGRVEINGSDCTVMDEGDVALIPANAAQRITNISDEKLVFLCVCTPRFRPDCYVALE